VSKDIIFIFGEKMNLEIFYDESYYNKLSDLILIHECKPIYPFEEMGIDPENLILGYRDDTAIYNFLKKVNFIYYCDQIYIGHTIIDGSEYIIEVNDEVTISILGDNESNWVKLLILDDDDFNADESYLNFEKFCLEKYSVTPIEPDYKRFGKLDREYLDL
jgi:hypothetical protein